jgi:hypothetical protein
MPLILRKTGDGRYILVGQVWLSGIMDGEACEGILESGEIGPGYSGSPVVDITLV